MPAKKRDPEVKTYIFITCSLFLLPSLSGMQSYTQKELNEKVVAAAYRGDSSCVKGLLGLRADVNYQQPNPPFYTPLLAAAYEARAELCKYLIEQRANVNAVDANGDSPLMHTIKAKVLLAFKILIEAGANPNQINKKGKTALILASHCAHHKAIGILLPLALYTPPANKVQNSRARIITALLSLKKLSFPRDVSTLIISYLGSDVARILVASTAYHTKFPVSLLNRAKREFTRLTIQQIKHQIELASRNEPEFIKRNHLLQVDSFEEKYGAIIREGIARRFGK